MREYVELILEHEPWLQSITSRILLANCIEKLHRVRSEMHKMPRVWHLVTPEA